ncbi:MAG: helix-turn-helix transcriptional regulator [Gemmatimonadota bacterium]
MEGRDPNSLLPLTDLAFNLLVVLSGKPLHGYALLKELRVRIGRDALRTGTVYAALARLQDSGLVGEVEVRPTSDSSDERRRVYQLTALGTAVARAEAQRLREVLHFAGQKNLVEGGS